MATMLCQKCNTTNQVPAGAQQAACGACGTVGNVAPVGVVMGQPIQSQMMMPLQAQVPAGTPAGLELLAMTDGIMVNQEMEWAEAITQAIGIGYESNNKYSICNKAGQKIYYVGEDTGCCWRFCCQGSRPAKLKVYDNVGRQVLYIRRHFRCCPCAWWGCLEQVDVTLGTTEQQIGQVAQPCCCPSGVCNPELNILNAQGQSTGMQIRGPTCFIGDCCGATFNILENEKEIGEIKKLHPTSATQAAQELLTDVDHFVMSYPQGTSTEAKATLLAALLLVDFQYFESGGSVDPANQSCTLGVCYCLGCPCDCTCSASGSDNGGGNGGGPVGESMVR